MQNTYRIKTRVIRHLLLSTVLLGGCVGQTTKTAPTAPKAPAPTVLELATISPAIITEGSVPFQLGITGSNFDANTVVLWNGVARHPVFQGPTSLALPIDTTDVAASGIVNVSLAANGHATTALPLTIAPALKISTLVVPAGVVAQSYITSLAGTGGLPPYRWSVASGTMPAGLTLNPTTGLLSGRPTTAGNYSFTVKLEDASLAKTISQLALAMAITAALSAPPPPMAASGYYGSGIGSDGLGNTTLGPNGNKISYRMRMSHSGNLSSVHPYLIMDHTGYSAGNGGTVLVSIQPDDGTPAHKPTGTKLASVLLDDPFAAVAPARYFPTFTFATPVAVQSGQIYHIVFENTDPLPAVNFVSVDSLYQLAAPTPSQPSTTDAECGVMLYSNYWPEGKVWKPRQGYTPIVQIDFEDGFTDGIGYMEAWVAAIQPVSGASSVRETFTVSGGSRTVSGVGVRVGRVSGLDSLKIRLLTSGGATVAEGQVAANTFPTGTKVAYVWAKYTFPAPVVLSDSQTYYLVLESPSTSVYQTFPIRKGSYYGFAKTTYFADGSAQFLQGGTWVGWTQWAVTNRTDSDLQFYFAP